MRKPIKIFNPKSLTLFVMFVLFATIQTQAEVVYSTPLRGEEHMIGNVLEWSTAFETDSKTFVVERSVDGLNYQNIGVVDGAGLSEKEKSYRFLDVNATTEKAYYRLQQTDVDGTSSTSQTIMVRKVLPNEFMIVSMSKTLTTDKFNISIDATKEGVLDYKLFSLQGSVVTEGNLALNFGLNDLAFDIQDEKEGIYKLELQKGKEIETLIIQKMDDEIKRKQNVASKNTNKGG